MEKQSEMKRGQTIAFRIPSDTPDHILRELQKLKEKERRNFSRKIAEYVVQGINQSLVKEKETITIPLPRKLSKAQHDWLKHEHSEAMLGSIVYQLIQDPLRVTSLFAALASKSTNIDEALYLQEDLPEIGAPDKTETANAAAPDTVQDDLDAFDWRTAVQEQAAAEEPEKEEDLEDLLGDFLASMNK
ncbi:hypothetical protein BpJC7_29680 [Weizmannia acidilactici]|uniref:Uncharacterized protein n=1 Tax=Weizmannia acidilactici TaxID=2607726 RepID=A0A5J4JLT2_9BACI|nr:hypothetical protein [Weizmannia acidilactici]GER71665.1 hypothetical protein BpJC7_29680 [Weizmannia acidilactici]